MCIISGPVKEVKDTKIFVMPSGDRQLVVYKNNVSSVAENLMILPVPNPNTIRFEKNLMRYYKNIFTDLKASLRWNRTEAKTLSIESSWSMRSAAPPLEVFDVGSYRVSVVPSVDDFYRLDQSVFSLPADLAAMMQQEYRPRMFGFVCCVLKAGLQKYEPLAYSHVRESPTTVFVPTKHYHLEQILGPTTAAGVADWDHEVYSLRTVRGANHCDGIPLPGNFLNSKKLPEEFGVGHTEQVHCWKKSGLWDNVDLEFQIVY